MLRTSIQRTRRTKVTEPKRIITTGSKSWRDWSTLHNALGEAYRYFDKAADTVVIDGGDRSGMDQEMGANFIANETWGSWFAVGYPVETYPAEEDPDTGQVLYRERNAKMIARGADLCLAFMPKVVDLPLSVDVSDAVDCVQRAFEAGIPVIIYEENPFNVG